MSANCCNNIYELCCVAHCATKTVQIPYKPTQTGKFYAVFRYEGTVKRVELQGTQNVFLQIPIGTVNENYTHIFHVEDEQGVRTTINIEGVEYDCYTVKTAPTLV